MMPDTKSADGGSKVNPAPEPEQPARRAFVAGMDPGEPQEARLLYSLAALEFEVYLLTAKDLSRSLRELDRGRRELTAYQPAVRPVRLPGIPVSPYAAVQAGKLPRGLLIMAGLDRAGINQTLDRLREQQLSGLALKAVATPHNLDWSVQALARELGREHCVTTAFVRLNRQVKRLPEPTNPAQRQALEAAQALLGHLTELTDDGPLLAALRQLASAYGSSAVTRPDQ